MEHLFVFLLWKTSSHGAESKHHLPPLYQQKEHKIDTENYSTVYKNLSFYLSIFSLRETMYQCTKPGLILAPNGYNPRKMISASYRAERAKYGATHAYQ